jgi:hypothetical protein
MSWNTIHILFLTQNVKEMYILSFADFPMCGMVVRGGEVSRDYITILRPTNPDQPISMGETSHGTSRTGPIYTVGWST